MVSVLNRDQILKRLNKRSPEIFVPGTWRESQIRTAGYDLRVDSAVRALNKEIFPGGKYVGEILYLEPGDSAFVLSLEQFIMPWDLAGNLGLRFRFAREGLSVMTGLLVDPGYGFAQHGRDWKAEGAALHFFLVNIGAEKISIRLGEEGDGVLSLQFLETKPTRGRKEISAPDDVAPATALGVYREIGILEKRLKKEKDKSKEKFGELEQSVENLRAVVETTRSATEHIVVFGVFLVAVTLIGVSATILVETLAGDNISTIIDNINRIHLDGTSATLVTLASILVIGVAIVALVAAFSFIFSAGFAGVRRRLRE
jgi:deoxycytidine triphosphate deaminase